MVNVEPVMFEVIDKDTGDLLCTVSRYDAGAATVTLAHTFHDAASWSAVTNGVARAIEALKLKPAVSS